MIHDLEEVKEMFKMADEIICANPSLLSMSTDQIFDELDDGTQEIFLERYISNYSAELEILVRRIGGEMYRCKSENVEKWNEDSTYGKCPFVKIDGV